MLEEDMRELEKIINDIGENTVYLRNLSNSK